MYDVIVVGAGPGGLLAGYHLEVNDLSYLILEKENVGQSWRNMRAGMLLLSPAIPSSDWTSLSLTQPIWDIPGVTRPFPTKDDFLCYMEKFVMDNRLNIKNKTRVRLIEKKEGGSFLVHTDEEEYESSFVIIATGSYAIPRFPDITGVRDNPALLHSSSFFKCMTYHGKKILVMGSGNSAAETAIELSGIAKVTLISKGELKFFTETSDLAHIRGFSESVLKELIRFGIITHIKDDGISSLDGGKVTYISGKREEFDVIVVATGFHPCLPPLEGMKVDTNGEGSPLITPQGESVTAEGLFFAGSLALFNDRCRFIHGFRGEVEKITWTIFDRL